MEVLGPNLFYNSPMEACVVICRMNKPVEKCGRILFINAVSEVTRERAFSYLTESHIRRIVEAFWAYQDVDGFANVAELDEVDANGYNLNIPLYVRKANGNGEGQKPLREVIEEWEQSAAALRQSMGDLFQTLDTTIGKQ